MASVSMSLAPTHLHLDGSRGDEGDGAIGPAHASQIGKLQKPVKTMKRQSNLKTYAPEACGDDTLVAPLK